MEELPKVSENIERSADVQGRTVLQVLALKILHHCITHNFELHVLCSLRTQQSCDKEANKRPLRKVELTCTGGDLPDEISSNLQNHGF
jgi:hypothetical protein